VPPARGNYLIALALPPPHGYVALGRPIAPCICSNLVTPSVKVVSGLTETRSHTSGEPVYRPRMPNREGRSMDEAKITAALVRLYGAGVKAGALAAGAEPEQADAFAAAALDAGSLIQLELHAVLARALKEIRAAR
jgi:hypothetical protein